MNFTMNGFQAHHEAGDVPNVIRVMGKPLKISAYIV